MMKTFGFLLVLLVGSAVIYAQVLGFELLNYDDDLYLYNSLVNAWSEATWSDRLLTPSLGYPLAVPTMLHAGVRAIAGYHPGYLHALNLVFHLANVSLLFVLLQRLTRHRWAAFLGTAIWAFHPVLAEAVSWVTSLKEVAVTFGVLVTFVALEYSGESKGRPILLATALLGVGWTIFSKPTGIVLGPLLLGYLVLIHWKSEPNYRNALGIMGVGALISASILAVLAYQEHETFGGQMGGFHPDVMVAAVGIQIQNYMVPLNLSPLYRFEGVPLEAWLFAPGVTVLLIWAALKSRVSAPLITFGILWLMVSWAPTSNLVLLRRFTSTSYAYLPTLGVAFVVAALVSKTWEARPPTGAIVVFATVSIVLGGMSFNESAGWRTSVLVWMKAAQQHPGNAFVVGKLGQAIYTDQRYDFAVEVFEAVPPETYHHPPVRWGLAHCRLGNKDRCLDILISAALSYEGQNSTTAKREGEWTIRVMAQAIKAFQLDQTRVPPKLRESIKLSPVVQLP